MGSRQPDRLFFGLYCSCAAALDAAEVTWTAADVQDIRRRWQWKAVAYWASRHLTSFQGMKLCQGSWYEWVLLQAKRDLYLAVACRSDHRIKEQIRSGRSSLERSLARNRTAITVRFIRRWLLFCFFFPFCSLMCNPHVRVFDLMRLYRMTAGIQK